MKETMFINKISGKKIPICGKGPFWAQKLRIFITLDPLEEFFFKFCTMKGANRHMRVILIIFQKNFLSGANEPFYAQKWHSLITLDPL